MYKILEARTKAAEQLKDPAHVRIAILGIFRIAMQHACVSLGEWIVHAIRTDSSRIASYTTVDISSFSQPADGSLVSLLSQLLVAAENIGWRSVGRQYWEQVELSGELRLLTTRSRANTESVLLSFVRNRNDGAEGHGLPGGYDPKIDVAVARTLLKSISHVLPIASKDTGQLYIPALGSTPPIELKTLRLIDQDPVCYRRLRRTSAGRLQVDVQVQKTLLTRDTATYEVENYLLDLPRPSVAEYQIAEPTWSDKWRPFVHIPERLASPDVFTGRAKQIQALQGWIDDPDGRKCMVWGDGGMGKTTMVVEFLHRMLEGTAGTEWMPEIITFYTAKRTRWGLNGLEQISAQNVGIADVALDIARMLTTPNLDRTWFEKSPKEVISKLAGLLAEMRVSRDQHLIILDNTETMARSDSDVQALAEQINELAKRVGRVILTSRRREVIEALPVQTENWTDIEGAEFVQKRGSGLRCKDIEQAGDATLRKYSRLLSNKPLALEVFVQAAATNAAGLDNAFQRVQRMQRQDLGQFLYDDAWARLAPDLRRVLLLMSRIGDSHDQYLMQLCCQRTDVTVAAASEAIEESRGIGTITRFEGNLQITFNPEFYNYCIERWEVIEGQKSPTPDDVDWVRRRYTEFIRSASSQVTDRNARAFRVPAARAAWKSFTEDKPAEALEYYELSLLADPENGWLYDRYAYTLMKLKRFEQALGHAKHAVALLPTDPEVKFTKGMVEARLGNAATAIADLDDAQKHGKLANLCELQKAYAYVYSKPRDIASAHECLEKARRMAPKDQFLSRFVAEANRFEKRWFTTQA